MKKHFILTLLISFAITTAFSQNWAWAVSAGDNNLEKGNGVATDPSGNIYVTGGFNSSTLVIGSATLANVGNSVQFFIAKYDAAGNPLWARAAGGAWPDEGNNVCTDKNGNAYVTGYFQSDTISFGSFSLIKTPNDSASDIFVVKYDPSGNVLWARSSGGNYYDYGHGIGTDSTNNVYVCGRFLSDSISFGAFKLRNHSQSTSNGIGSDLFIVKFDSNGNPQWAQRAGGLGGEEADNLAVDKMNNVYVTGLYGSDTLRVGAFKLANTHDSTLNYANLFVARYSTSGNVVWAKGFGGNYTEIGYGLTTDNSGNAFVTGRFYSKQFPIGTYTLVNADTSGTWYDIFTAKFDLLGNVVWAKGAGGPDPDEGLSAATDSYGNVYITGYYYSLSCGFGTSSLSNSGGFKPNIFLAKYDPLGTLVYAYTPGGSQVDEGHGITRDAADNIYLTGLYASANTSFGSTTLPQAGYGDIFLAKLLPPTAGVTSLQGMNPCVIYPNPSSGRFIVSVTGPIETVSVYNAVGEQIDASARAFEHGFALEIEESGIYFIKIKTAGEIRSGKIIVSR